jgi:hypothetical protein
MFYIPKTSDKAYQLLDRGRWFSSGTTVSSTTKTGRHDMAEILLKVELNTIKIKSTNFTNMSKILSSLHFINRYYK